MAALAGVALGAAGVATWLGTRPTPSPPATRTTLRLPEGVAPSSLDRPIAISPDGSRLVLAARSEARELLWLRRFGDLRWQELAGTEDASYPFWSPDGGSLGFFANGKLKRLDLATGVVRTLCDAAVGRGATWGSRGTIVFSPGAVGPLQQVSADGGTPAALLPTARDGEDQRNPHFLPDGRSFLFWARNRGAPGERAIYAFDAGRGGAKKLLDNPAEAIYVEPGYLAFVADGNLMLQPFDAGRLALSGSPRPVAANVRFTGIRSWIAVALAPDGLLVYQDAPGEPPFQLLWAELGGAETPAWEGALGVRVEGAFLSPDGRRAASYWVGPGAAVHSEILDFGAGTRSRLGTLRQDRMFLPAWFPSGDRVAVRAMVDGEFQLGWMPAGPDEEVHPLTSTTGFDYLLGSVTPDGRSILFSRASDTDQLGDIYLVDVEGGAPPRPVLGGPGQESRPRLSPDGRWLAFLSEGSGRLEIWVTDFPAATGRWQVSSNTEERGARIGRWGWLSADELWWKDADGRLVAASLAWRGREIEVGARRLLLGGRALADTETVFDYSPVRKRFLMGREVGARPASELVVVSDWRAALRAGERSP